MTARKQNKTKKMQMNVTAMEKINHRYGRVMAGKFREVIREGLSEEVAFH